MAAQADGCCDGGSFEALLAEALVEKVKANSC